MKHWAKNSCFPSGIVLICIEGFTTDTKKKEKPDATQLLGVNGTMFAAPNNNISGGIDGNMNVGSGAEKVSEVPQSEISHGKQGSMST